MFKKLRYKFWLHTITIDKYKSYLQQEGISEEDMCYSVDTHTCDARCQGCCSCPMIGNGKITRKQMMKYDIEGHEFSKEKDILFSKIDFKKLREEIDANKQ